VTRNPEHYWEPRGAIIKPYLFDATVAPYNIRIELTPTDHAAVLRVTFPIKEVVSAGESALKQEKRICFIEAAWDNHGVIADTGGQYIKGRATQVHEDRMITSGFSMFILVESKEATDVDSHNDMTCLRFRNDAGSVIVRMATSFISHDQAKLNMRREVKNDKSFDQVSKESKTVWRNILKRVDVVDPGEHSEFASRNLAVFYTGLYRALMFPRRIDEFDANQQVVHYSPYDPHSQPGGPVKKGVLVTDNGFWDTFRTVYPLLSLAYPDHLAVIIQGWLNAYSEGGWLPSWASPGYRNCMVGTFADVVIADAIVKGVTGFDLMMAKDALLKDAFEEPPKFSDGAVGKVGLREYIDNGFLAYDQRGGEVVSRTVDYGFADFATAQALQALIARDEDNKVFDSQAKEDLQRKAKTLLERSQRAYSSLFNKQSGLLTPRSRSDSRLPAGFSAIEWGNGYTEGSPWHHSFPPYGIYTGNERELGKLVDLHGGKSKLLSKLKELLQTPSNFKFGSYGQQIHEMVEMRAVAMGQYGHNNQPCHHLLYLFALLGDSKSTQCLVRGVMSRAYGEDFYAGDEDNGEQGAWFVLSALGLFSVTPGTKSYVLGSPIFKHVRISRDEQQNQYQTFYDTDLSAEDPKGSIPVPLKLASKSLDIISAGVKESVCEVAKVLLNDTEIAGVTVEDALLQRDGVLRFVMAGEEVAGENLNLNREEFREKSVLELENTVDSQKRTIMALVTELQSLKGKHVKSFKLAQKLVMEGMEGGRHPREDAVHANNMLTSLWLRILFLLAVSIVLVTAYSVAIRGLVPAGACTGWEIFLQMVGLRNGRRWPRHKSTWHAV